VDSDCAVCEMVGFLSSAPNHKRNNLDSNSQQTFSTICNFSNLEGYRKIVSNGTNISATQHCFLVIFKLKRRGNF
jgi:hypothetical protein